MVERQINNMVTLALEAGKQNALGEGESNSGEGWQKMTT